MVINHLQVLRWSSKGVPLDSHKSLDDLSERGNQETIGAEEIPKLGGGGGSSKFFQWRLLEALGVLNARTPEK